MHYNNILLYLSSCICGLLFVACEQNTIPTESTSNTSSGLYAGEFTYGADAASFKHCKTGQQYPVIGKEAYIRLERAYMNAEHDSFQPEWVQLEGHLEEQIGNSGKKEIFLVVDNFIGLEEGRLCE